MSDPVTRLMVILRSSDQDEYEPSEPWSESDDDSGHEQELSEKHSLVHALRVCEQQRSVCGERA